MIKIQNVPTESLMAFQQILEMSNVHFKEASDDLMTQHSKGNIGIVFRNDEANELERRYHSNQNASTNIQKELDRRLKKTFDGVSSGTYLEKVKIRLDKEIESYANILKERKEKSANLLGKHGVDGQKKKVIPLDLNISKEKKIKK